MGKRSEAERDPRIHARTSRAFTHDAEDTSALNLIGLPTYIRHGFQGLRDAANAAALPWNDESVRCISWLWYGNALKDINGICGAPISADGHKN